MSFFDDIESVLEKVTKTATPAGSTLTLLDWIITSLQGALNAPNQHEQVQKAVSVLSANKAELAAAVETPGSEDHEPAGEIA
jgi:hypothetical protein